MAAVPTNLPAISVEVETDMEETAGSADAGAVSAPHLQRMDRMKKL